MNRLKEFVSDDRVIRFGFAAFTIVALGLTLVFTVQAREVEPFRFPLTPASATIANCFQGASAIVSVLPREESHGVDTLDIKAERLPPNTEFTVFLTELPDPPFGAAEYIADFTTNEAGRGSVRVDSVINDAFSSTVVNGTRVRKDLNHIVLWFADPESDDVCFAPGTGPVTPFDGDGIAGGTALSSRNFLPGAPLP